MEIIRKWANDIDFNATLVSSVAVGYSHDFVVTTTIGYQILADNLIKITKDVEDLHEKIIKTHFNVQSDCIIKIKDLTK